MTPAVRPNLANASFKIDQLRRWLSLIFLSILPVCFDLHAHPDLIEQIAQITSQLGKQPHTGNLYLQRANLFRRHSEYDAALLDIANAERWETNATVILLARARVYCDAGRSEAALSTVEEVLRLPPGEPEGLLIRARSRARLGQIESAVKDYDAAIARSIAPGPDVYLERARLLARLERWAEAAQGLDAVISNSPAASPLQLAAIEYDRQRGAFEAALARVDRLIAAYPVREPWLTLRAEVLEQAARREEAHATYETVLASIEHYPAARRTLDLTKQLEARARQGWERTATSRTTAQ